MRSMKCLSFAAGVGGLLAPAGTMGQEVAEARAAQRTGTKLVDVYYSLTGSDGPFTVTLDGSADGETTWALPVAAVSGDVGAGVVAGTNRHITWNAEADWNSQFSENVRFRVTATRSVSPPDTAEFALIPAGSFQMGDAMGDSLDVSWAFSEILELPVHSVHVSEFCMAKYEVTKALWDEVRAWAVPNGYTDLPRGSHNGATSYGKGPNHPVYNVTWHDVVKWCNARSEKEGLTPCYMVGGTVYRTGSSNNVVCDWNAGGYRLPTEAEWEKAARGGLSGGRFPWGNTISHAQANYYSVWEETGAARKPYYSYDVSSTEGSHPDHTDGVLPNTSPVGSFAANEYGLYDVTGNLGEWCWDWFASNYYATSPASDPRGPPSDSSRVVRGGNAGNPASFCRVARRNFIDPSGRYVVSFRLARGVASGAGAASTRTASMTVDTRRENPPAEDALWLLSVTRAGATLEEGVILSWATAPGRLYNVERSVDLANWEVVARNVTGDPPVNTVVDVPPVAGGRAFYRVVLLERADPGE